MEKKPVFFAATKSFWLTVCGMAILVFEAPHDVLYGIAMAVSFFFPEFNTDQVFETLKQVAPAVLWFFAIQQRSHAARPYTIDPRAIK